MPENKVWELVDIFYGLKPVGCKWIFKTKRDSKDSIETKPQRTDMKKLVAS